RTCKIRGRNTITCRSKGMSIRRLDSILRPEVVFLLIAALVSIAYLSTYSPFGTYRHGVQRFFYAISRAHDLHTGQANSIPVSFIARAHLKAPRTLASLWPPGREKKMIREGVWHPRNPDAGAIPLRQDLVVELPE